MSSYEDSKTNPRCKISILNKRLNYKLQSHKDIDEGNKVKPFHSGLAKSNLHPLFKKFALTLIACG